MRCKARRKLRVDKPEGHAGMEEVEAAFHLEKPNVRELLIHKVYLHDGCARGGIMGVQRSLHPARPSRWAHALLKQHPHIYVRPCSYSSTWVISRGLWVDGGCDLALTLRNEVGSCVHTLTHPHTGSQMPNKHQKDAQEGLTMGCGAGITSRRYIPDWRSTFWTRECRFGGITFAHLD